MSLPTADDLFRRTAHTDEDQQPPSPVSSASASSTGERPRQEATGAAEEQEPGGRAPRRRSSGRVRHDEKMTVYVTADELLELEHARLTLRRGHGLAVDRGRLVREAVAIALADYELNGEDSVLVQRLMQA